MSSTLHLFEAFGVEIEYAIVDFESLDVRPIADRLLERVGGEPGSDIDRGPIAWSNELALHVIELKTNGPASGLSDLPAVFQTNISEAAEVLEDLGARLMPGAMHPWMDPLDESRLWPHEYNDVYKAYDRIFGCSGHGWTNLQSVHINLPFAGDDEFHRLHASIRLLLPLLPAIAASSPIVDGKRRGALDERLLAYMANSSRVPSVAGSIVPEPVASEGEYQREILERIYRDLAPHDPNGILRHEWANARGAIARFDRGSIEIRLLDSQECATSDIALVAAVVDAVRWIAMEVDPRTADAVSTEDLAGILSTVVRDGDTAPLPDGDFKRALQLGGGQRTAGLAWSTLLDRAASLSAEPRFAVCLERTLSRGPLARRIISDLGEDPSADRLRGVYRQLCDCLVADEPFESPLP